MRLLREASTDRADDVVRRTPRRGRGAAHRAAHHTSDLMNRPARRAADGITCATYGPAGRAAQVVHRAPDRPDGASQGGRGPAICLRRTADDPGE
ncbi:hypothetical protein JCM18899A_43210 [Nocardioides sp. AN3]